METPEYDPLSEEETETPEDLELEELMNSEFPVSAEPELVAETAAPSEEIQETEASHLTSTVCDCCLILNLTTKVDVIRCDRCEQPFCFHFASMIDARFCVNCMSEVAVTKSTISKDYVHRDGEGNVTSVYRRKAKEIKITGTDWLFMQRKIVDMTDLELDLSIEFHRNALTLMINEQETRRMERLHKLAGIKVTLPLPRVSTDGTTVTTVKKTKTISKNKAQEQINALLGSMLKGGTSMDQIAELLKGGK